MRSASNVATVTVDREDRMNLLINGSVCTGHGRCYTLAPSLVEPDDNGFATPADTPIEVAAQDEEQAVRIAGTCPEGAISIQ